MLEAGWSLIFMRTFIRIVKVPSLMILTQTDRAPYEIIRAFGEPCTDNKYALPY